MDGEGREKSRQTSDITAGGEGHSDTSAYNNTAKLCFVPLL
jgi:hypothetical protein